MRVLGILLVSGLLITLCAVLVLFTHLAHTGPEPCTLSILGSATRVQGLDSLAIKQQPASWRNGDLIFITRWPEGLYTLPGLRHWVQHAGIVWEHPTEGVCVVDMNDWTVLTMLDLRTGATDATRRVVRAAEYVAKYPGLVWRRPLVRGALDPAAYATALEWGLTRPYNHGISFNSDEFQFNNLLAVVVSAFSPALAQRLTSQQEAPIDNAEKYGVMCSQMVLAVLQRVGALPLDFPSHIVGPHALTHKVGMLDAAGLRTGFAWGPEQLVTADMFASSGSVPTSMPVHRPTPLETFVI